MPIKIREIQADMRGIEVIGQITGISPRRQVQTRFGLADVATATLRDETGSIHINLWRDQINVVQEGKFVRVINGFGKIYRERLELNIGRDGRIIPIEQPY